MENWLVTYRREWLRPDVIAGLTAAAVVIPKAMAYATIAGLPVQVGLYTAFLPMVIYAVLGTSRVLSVSTTTTIAILAAAELGEVVPNGNPASLLTASATLTLLVGAMLVLASILRLGFVANFISEPVLIGFKAGIGVVIVLDQIPKILGTHFAKGTFVQNLLSTLHGIPDTSLATLAVGVSMIVLLVAMEHFTPKAPAPLIAVAAGIAGAYFLNLHARGVELVGHIPQGLPSFTPPVLSLAERLWPGALGIALMSFTETIAAGRAFARSDEPSPKPNRELLATGLANAGGALSGRDARWRRHNPDSCESSSRSAHTVVGNRNRGHDSSNYDVLGAAHWLNAASYAGSRGHCLFDRIDQACGISRNSQCSSHGVYLGPHRLCGSGAGRDIEGNHCGDHCLNGRTCLPGG